MDGLHPAPQHSLGDFSELLAKEIEDEEVGCGVEDDEQVDDCEVLLEPGRGRGHVDGVEDEGEQRLRRAQDEHDHDHLQHDTHSQRRCLDSTSNPMGFRN